MGSVQQALAQALALHKANRAAEAEPLYRAILAEQPDHFDALHMLGVIEAQRGRFREAAQLMAQALSVNRDSAEALTNAAYVLNHLQQHADALAACDRALQLKPDYAGAHNTRGAALHALGRYEEALASADRALACNPRHAIALANRGSTLAQLRRREEAVASFDSALAIDPAFPDAWRNRGHTLRDLGRHPAAVDSYARALHVNADDVAALASRGHLLHYLGRNDEAARDFARVVALSPHSPYAWSMLSMLHRHNCDWDAADAAFARVREALANGAAVEPFPFLVQSASAADQKRCAELAVASAVPSSASPLWHGERYEHAKIRVAYLSADFREHATAYLIADVLERHDRSRFEVTAVSWCAEEATATRERLKRAVDTFVDVQAWTDEEVARWLRERRIDIVVDLMGFANGARPGICARRPAPVQVNFLGYPGTMGAPYLDYIVADTTLIAPDAHRDFTERVVCMPDSYQPNDRERPIAPDTPSREACGLPESGFVFCSFNSTYKITPAMFDVWMRLLARVEGSVLWLLAGTATSAANLRREAASRGVAPQRLVFAPRLALAAHLARQRNAQLFLDTLPCNAHTTASDALWVGLPVVTCLGTTFAGRVAGSLLRAAGLPELVAESVGEYEALALRLATHDDELATVREKLTRNRMSCALFDSDRYRGHLESAFATMTERARAGLPPAPFAAA